MAAALDYSVASMNPTSYPPRHQFEFATDLPPLCNVSISKFYRLIGEHPPAPTEDQTKPPVRRQENARGHLFGTFGSFIDVLKKSLRKLEGNGK
jgi:hypothetical protein